MQLPSMFALIFLLVSFRAQAFPIAAPKSGFATQQEEALTWEKVEVPGTFCGNGTPYKFFISPAANSSDLTIIFEPGGACWDFASCSGKVRGASNAGGIKDNHMSILRGMSLHTPFVFRSHPRDRVEPARWNRVYFPYCTGDVHGGSQVVTYEDPLEEEPNFRWHHVGYQNIERIIPWLQQRFSSIGKLFITGCSAGGSGALINYHNLRSRLAPAQAYLLNDSGPIYPADTASPSWEAQQMIRSVWGAREVYEKLKAELSDITTDNLGSINKALANHYEEDRLAHTQFTRDPVYSAYLYERFFDPAPSSAEIHQLWWQEQSALTGLYDNHQNLAYFIPYERKFTQSHCTTLITFFGSKIPGAGDIGQFINQMLDRSRELTSHIMEYDDVLAGNEDAD